jgi:hypothetical protein
MAKTKIPGEYLVDGGITVAKMAANSVDSDQYVDGSIDLIHMSVNSIDSDQYVDGSIDTIHIADGAITSAKLDTNIAVGGTLGVTGETTMTGLTVSESNNGDPVLGHFYNNNAGTATEATVYITNSSTISDGLFLETTGSSFTTVGGFVQDGGVIGTGAGASGGLSIMTRANADMRFYTNGHTNERMIIDSSGSTSFTTGTNDGVKITGAENSAYINSSFIADVNTKGSFIGIARPEDGNATNNGIGTYDSTGNAKNNLAITSRSDIVFAGNDGEMGRFLGTGGLTFNGDTAAANALDDYEEGTWTPSLTNATGTFSNDGATYTKVGRIVTVNFRLNPSGSAGVVANSTHITNLLITILTIPSGF